MEMDGKEYFVTKPELARKMIEKIPDSEWKKAENILTVNSKVGEWVIEIYKKYGKEVANRVKIVPAGEKTKLFIKKTLNILGLYEYNILDIKDKNGNETYDVRDLLELDDEKIIELAGMPRGSRFSCCIMNPPYNNGLGDKFLNKVLDIANIVVSIQPESYLFKGKNGNPIIKEKLLNGYTNIETIDANNYFDAGFQNIIGIIYYDSTKNGKVIIDNNEIKDLNNIKRYFNDELLVEFASIVNPLIRNDNIGDKWCGTPGSHYPDRFVNIEDEDPNAWCVQAILLRGHVAPKQKDGKADDFYTLITNNEQLIQKQFIGRYKDLIKLRDNKNKLKLQYYFKFNSQEEAFNFVNYIKTDFARACLYLEKKDMNVIWHKIPWFDFSDSHFSKSPKEIDNWLFKKYNISDEIRKHIEEILPDYYNIRK